MYLANDGSKHDTEYGAIQRNRDRLYNNDPPVGNANEAVLFLMALSISIVYLPAIVFYFFVVRGKREEGHLTAFWITITTLAFLISTGMLVGTVYLFATMKEVNHLCFVLAILVLVFMLIYLFLYFWTYGDERTRNLSAGRQCTWVLFALIILSGTAFSIFVIVFYALDLKPV